MRVMVVAPHPDDEVLGAGGTILHHVTHGAEVYVCFVADRVYGHTLNSARAEEERECALEAKRLLGYREAIFLGLEDERLDGFVQEIIVPLERAAHSVQPDVAYLPHRGDNNQDHRAVFAASQVVFRPAASTVQKLFCYEVPSSTDQTPSFADTVFLPNCYVDISPHLEGKIEALNCYERERRQFPHPRSAEAIRALAVFRGAPVGFDAAEAFMMIRERVVSKPDFHAANLA